MVGHHAGVCLMLMLLLVLAPTRGAWAGSPSDQLSAGMERVLKILGDPELEGDAKLNQRRAAIIIVAGEIFDFGEMAKRSLGQYWTQRTLAERGEFVRLFTAAIEHSYISKVDQRGAGKMTRRDQPRGELPSAIQQDHPDIFI